MATKDSTTPIEAAQANDPSQTQPASIALPVQHLEPVSPSQEDVNAPAPVVAPPLLQPPVAGASVELSPKQFKALKSNQKELSPKQFKTLTTKKKEKEPHTVITVHVKGKNTKVTTEKK